MGIKQIYNQIVANIAKSIIHAPPMKNHRILCLLVTLFINLSLSSERFKITILVNFKRKIDQAMVKIII